jgi:hypothetical protein
MGRAFDAGMRSLVVVALLTSTAAAAPAITTRTVVRGTTATATGTTATEAIHRAHLEDECQPTCTSALVKQTSLPNGGALQLHVATSPQLQGKLVRMAHRDASGAWTAWSTNEVVLADNACGKGTCADQDVESVVISRSQGIVWFHLRVKFALTHEDPAARRADRIERHDIVIGCKPTTKLACAVVETERDWTSSVFIAGNTVTARYRADNRLRVNVNRVTF